MQDSMSQPAELLRRIRIRAHVHAGDVLSGETCVNCASRRQRCSNFQPPHESVLLQRGAEILHGRSLLRDQAHDGEGGGSSSATTRPLVSAKAGQPGGCVPG